MGSFVREEFPFGGIFQEKFFTGEGKYDLKNFQKINKIKFFLMKVRRISEGKFPRESFQRGRNFCRRFSLEEGVYEKEFFQVKISSNLGS